MCRGRREDGTTMAEINPQRTPPEDLKGVNPEWLHVDDAEAAMKPTRKSWGH